MISHIWVLTLKIVAEVFWDGELLKDYMDPYTDPYTVSYDVDLKYFGTVNCSKSAGQKASMA